MTLSWGSEKILCSFFHHFSLGLFIVVIGFWIVDGYQVFEKA